MDPGEAAEIAAAAKADPALAKRIDRLRKILDAPSPGPGAGPKGGPPASRS